MHRYIIILLLTFTVSLQAEMKCEAGKCGTGKSVVKKDIPKKEVVEKKILKKEYTQEIKKRDTAQSKLTIEQLFNVRTVKVERLSTAKEQVNYGYIVAQDSRKVDVVAWFSGYVEKLFADTLYKKVEKGEALATVYSPEVYKAKQDYLNSLNFNAKRPAPGMLKSAKAKLRLLGVSKEEINYVRNVRRVNEFTTIYAPISGWIFQKNINQGSAFNPQKKLFQIINLDKVWLEAKLFQNELEGMSQLQHFIVKLKGLQKDFNATKSLLYPMLDPKVATATLRLDIDNSEGLLKPGMYAKVHASADSASHLVIPRTAAIRKNGTWYAFLATEFKGEYEPVAIELKPLDTMYYIVIKGLKENDTVVNNALFMMDSDAQINGIY
ncbi:efflux RND transporter periplasmic adaptor subunit [Sulfurovum sp. CS9]|uniref:efflux RND transporter periplasmic adaptor subunit n=1 Tax=Sulfurovum sp. CS9 TaxID=3391146 RepID=UPI0039E960AB